MEIRLKSLLKRFVKQRFRRILGIVKAFRSLANRRKHLAGRRQAPTVILCSTGGSASTTVMEFLARFTELNDFRDRDGLKHLKRPSFEALEGCRKIIFLYDEPPRVVESLDRRGLLRNHAVKYNFGYLLSPRALIKKGLQSHIRKQIDSFPDQQKSTVLKMSFAELFDRPEEIAYFLGLAGGSFAEEFPERRIRASDS